MKLKKLAPIGVLFSVSLQSYATDLKQTLQSYVDDNNLPGVVLAVQHKGKMVFHDAVGYANIEAKEKMTTEHNFRWFSQSKAVTAYALLKAINDNDLTTQNTLQDFYPSFEDGPTPLKYLLNHSAGFPYGGNWSSLKGWAWAILDPLERSDTLLEMMSSLDDLPVMFEPGTGWEYGVASDMQGAVIERIVKKPFEQYIAEHIFKPMGMETSGFVRKGHNTDTPLLPMYRYDNEQSKAVLMEEQDEYDKPVFSGGSGMYGTAEDYVKFLQYILYPDTHRDFVDPALVEEMSTNQLPDQIERLPDGLYPDSGFGYGVAVQMTDGEHLPKGTLRWAGLGGTIFWVDPKNELVVVGMRQVLGGRKAMEKLLVPLVYEFIESQNSQT